VSQYIIVGVDAHSDSLVVKWAADKAEPEQMTYPNTSNGRRALQKKLARASRQHGDARVVCAYEASYQGTGLRRDLQQAGFTCHVLAPTKIARPAGGQKQKADPRDAEHLLELLRAHLLAGNSLPAIWVPDQQTLEDREVVRGRLEVAKKLGRVRSQVASLMARWDVTRPGSVGGSWTRSWCRWAEELAQSILPPGPGQWLLSLLRQAAFLQQERARLDTLIAQLSLQDRYRQPVRALTSRCGIGLLVAMVFLTELGDLSRFSNRRQIAAYVGLVPSSHDSGERERKGHITRQGSFRVRKVLCQAAWVALRHSAQVQKAYARIAQGPGKRHKIAIVALMRRLAVWMWHVGLRAQRAAPVALPT